MLLYFIITYIGMLISYKNSLSYFQWCFVKVTYPKLINFKSLFKEIRKFKKLEILQKKHLTP